MKSDFCKVITVEAAPGVARFTWLAECLDEYARVGTRTFHLPCDFACGGPWAGVTELFSTLFPEIERSRPDLLEQHAFELAHVLPLLRRKLKVRNPNLTDMAPGSERTRNYPADRAVRNVHGLIDLLYEWKSSACPATPWVFACDGFDQAGAMASLFFRELMRRRAKRLEIRLLAGVDCGKGVSVCHSFDKAVLTESVAPEFGSTRAADPDSLEAEEMAVAIEQQIGDDELERQAHLPRLIHLWTRAKSPAKILDYRYLALEIYNTQGLYADAIRYGEGLLELARQERPADDVLRWLIFQKLLMSHLGLEHVDASQKLIEETGLPLAEKNAGRRNHIYYLMAMIYARFTKPRDFAKGEEYLERGLTALAESDLPEGESHFRFVFNRNGLAMIRNFQRRPAEAIELCRNGFAHLNQHLGAHEHRLHRSILLYNIAQVYGVMGNYEEALQYYSATITLDPNYSEYYNERASALLHLDRLEEAEADFLRAIELSPPYFEVFTNLGQCYRRMGAMQRAIEQYSKALDLQPRQPLARLGRAKAYEELESGRPPSKIIRPPSRSTERSGKPSPAAAYSSTKRAVFRSRWPILTLRSHSSRITRICTRIAPSWLPISRGRQS